MLKFDELTDLQKSIINENEDSLLNNESVKFNENNIDYEIYIIRSLMNKLDILYMIEKFI
jgi:hypothetical protein